MVHFCRKIGAQKKRKEMGNLDSKDGNGNKRNVRRSLVMRVIYGPRRP